MRAVTVALSPAAVPAVPDSAGVLLFVTRPSAGAVSVTAGAIQSAAVEMVLPAFVLCAVNAAFEPGVVVAAKTTAASAATASGASGSLMPAGPRGPPRRRRARAARGPTGRR